ncbi:hypothetical protein [Aquisalibacillus elongatus]|uniref:Peptidyl-prolyl cis-trans isomerase n=1 Tax=Aquisalibacillus elongatus TaxID=485577 RepID=A0A3N5BEI8_9BACI|nr:hypothetical protein [Aquisalibacillus elongatus]RPF56126.1 hypothetical protein EDC24_1015 [Aquisalibacillus elongatus]
MYIVQIQGNVRHPITLDPTVWIFDDRKILLDEAFNNQSSDAQNHAANEDTPFNRNQYQQKMNPPINESVKKFDRKKVLENSYLMPINHFLPNAEPDKNATKAILHTDDGQQEITIDELNDSLLLFALDGKPLKDDGPVHLYFNDGRNYDAPIKSIKKIHIE